MNLAPLRKLYIVAAVLATLAAAPDPSAAEERAVKLTIAATNDFHGYLDPHKPDLTGGKPAGGAEYLSFYLNSMRDEDPEGFILLDAGDFMAGSLIGNYTKGKAVVDFYNLMGYDALAVGNHEFDFGALEEGGDTLGALKKRISEAAFPVLGANIYDRKTGKRLSTPNLKPFHIIERKGAKIGIIGVTTVLTPITTHPMNIQGLEFRFGAEEIKKIIPALREHGVNVVIVLAHAGAVCEGGCSGEIVEIARSLSPEDVHVIVSGHTHTRIAEPVNGIPIVQSYSKGVAISRVDLYLDEATKKVLRDRTKIHPPLLTLNSPPPEPVNPDPSLFAPKPRVVPDAKVAKFMAMYKEMLAKIKDQHVCTAEVSLRRRIHGESPVGVLLTDAMRTFFPGVHIAMYNSGGIRADLPAGKVTYGSIFEVIPFDNSLIKLTLTGAQVKEIVEKGASRSFGLMAISGIEATVDMASKPGEKVKALTVGGKPLDPAATYTVATNDFLLSGGDGFKTFSEGKDVVNTQTLIRDIFEGYLRRIGTVKAAPPGNYALLNWPFKADESP
ncbi:MAG: 5'-nucleotidase C-terminal domain-containing protein [Deltaproteobacteria bacterium]|nr:5'-nucleotidase C-terminal domain-containing protein [Deltaproteobacteria bacterium]